jgi:hypothetical protein
LGAPAAAAPLTGARRIVAALRGDVLVFDALGRTAIALELLLDPVHRGPVAVSALPPIAELREAFDGRLVALEVEAADQRLHGLVRHWRSRLRRG